MECGNPVPSEMLEESGLPDRNIDRGPQEIEPPKLSKTAGDQQTEEQVGDLQPKLIGDDMDRGEELKPQLMGGDTYEKGKALKPKLMGLGEDEAGEALKPRLIGGEEQSGSGEKVRATMQNSSADTSDTAVEKLIFCPNCGMHMQHNLNKCEICGMALGNKPNNVPTTSSGIPLFNTDPDPFSGTGGLGNFTGGFGGISDEDVARIDNFAKGNPDPMFNSGGSTFNVQATPNDFAHLTEQLANFSTAAGMPTIETTENTRIRQKAVPKGKDVEISDFSMSDDLTSETIPLSDRHVPVLGEHSMEETDEYINLDPFAFVGMSMDEDPPMRMPEAQPEAAEFPEAVPVEQPQPTEVVPVIDDSRFDPIQPPPFAENAPEETLPEETSPFIAEAPPAPVLSGSAMPSAVNTEKPEPPETVTEAPIQPPQQEQPVQQEPPVRQEQPIQQEQPVQQAVPQQPQAVPQEQQYQQMQPGEEPPRPAEKTKKCYACGRTMPAKDKFCPNCGRSMFGVPNPNLMTPAPPQPPPAKKKPVAAIVIVVIVLIAAVVAGIILLGKKSEAIGLSDISQAVSSTEQALLSDTVTEQLIS